MILSVLGSQQKLFQALFNLSLSSRLLDHVQFLEFTQADLNSSEHIFHNKMNVVPELLNSVLACFFLIGL
jgi:hypothetical protein